MSHFIINGNLLPLFTEQQSNDDFSQQKLVIDLTLMCFVKLSISLYDKWDNGSPAGDYHVLSRPESLARTYVSS